MKDLNDGIELSIVCYLTSDETGLETKVTVSGIKNAIDLESLDCTSVGAVSSLSEVAGDFRPMTREEIADYKRRDEEDKREEDECHQFS